MPPKRQERSAKRLRNIGKQREKYPLLLAKLIDISDIVLEVFDARFAKEMQNKEIEKLIKDRGKKIIYVLNKSDLPFQIEIGKLPPALNNTVKISAKSDTGIDGLREKILKLAGTDNFDLRQAVCTTARQENLLIRLTNAKSKDIAGAIITELLNAPLSV